MFKSLVYSRCLNQYLSHLQVIRKRNIRLTYPFHIGLCQKSYATKKEDFDQNLIVINPLTKTQLNSLIREISLKLQEDVCKPTITTQRHDSTKWKTTLSLQWPEPFVVEGISTSKSQAENKAILQAFSKLKKLDVLDENNCLSLNGNMKSLSIEDIRESKITLANIFNYVTVKYGSQNWRPTVSFSSLAAATKEKIGFKATVNLKWPESYQCDGFGRTKIEAERTAAYKAVEWLRNKGAVDQQDIPVFYTEDEKKAFQEIRREPLPLFINASSAKIMKSILQEFEDRRDSIVSGIITPKRYNSTLTSLIDQEEIEEVEASLLNKEGESFTDKEMSKNETERSEALYEGYVLRSSWENFDVRKIKAMQESLPIFDKREEILNMIEQNQVIVLSGEPGCGKTTQVPQFILDEFSSKHRGGVCNVVVTQPKRLSTINVAKLVASQRLEELGETIGYEVRLKRVRPPRHGSILYCSTGILLRKMHFDPDLLKYSHVIVDEVHERDIQTDFLLVLLKYVIKRNPQLKVIVMSATLNAELFSEYFNDCPKIHVPGFMYPVKEHFIPEIVSRFPKNASYDHDSNHRPRLNIELVVDTIRYIDQTQSFGAILCFLPGWQDIKVVREKLLEEFGNSSKHMICPVHSSISYSEQELIFSRPPPGVRKIILSTNIAETSITVDDVVYVIDPGLCKEINYDSSRGISQLAVEWISKANAKQRLGRAGRVQPGECFRLYTKEALEAMEDFPIPDMLRTPLENVVINSKVFCPDILCEELLAKAPQPPSKRAIRFAVAELTQLGVLDKNEDLTLLGEKVVRFPTHPRLAVALVVSSFLKCLDPTLNIVSLLSMGRFPFNATMDEKLLVKKVKQKFDITTTKSDHLALSAFFQSWKLSKDTGGEKEFNSSNMVNHSALTFAEGLKNIFAKTLEEVGIVYSHHYFKDNKEFDKFNSFSPNWENSNMVLAALTSAFYPNLVRVYQGSWGIFGKKSNTVDLINLYNQKVDFTKESLVAKEMELPHPFVIYFNCMRSVERNMLIIKDASPVSSLILFLSASTDQLKINKINKDKESSEKVVVVLDSISKLSFKCTKSEAELLLQWRECFNILFQYFLSQNIHNVEVSETKDDIVLFIQRYLEEFGTILSINSDTISTS